MGTEERILIHVRFTADLIEYIDQHVEKMQREAQKIVPGVEISRGDALNAIVTEARARNGAKEKRK